MLRHRFQPGRLVAGVFLMLAGVVYAGDGSGLWETPWYVLIPLVNGGLCIAAVVGMVARAAHRRRGAPSAPAPGEPRADVPR
ncbi:MULTISPECIES: hypothetical protein [Streptomyces]|uniref:Uncharacterized protein n=1 Tax=Streptomyces ardesiacus TaxID=285564 RepID=A0ABW8HAK6_9ACTN|nr:MULTISPECIES: hypothetical protein [Streptomyces]MCL7368101.1 hypothetical protein [Streptomyces ardesiacus]NEB63914.1 hypothetical protein [Streptomyces diastaticus]NED02962.1 hypothetical protein [Streptomyces sp. SID6648]